MKKRPKTNMFTIVFLWLLLICTSAAWNIYQSWQTHQQVNLESARSYFSLIVTMRAWNSRLGGVYAPVSEQIQPNPYLEIPDRDIHLPDGVTLTKINPAYMTRLVAELAEQTSGTRFHITSSNPIRPGNAPSAWESTALALFEGVNAQSEYFDYDTQGQVFYYMAPLVTEQSCLACHAKQGYKVGDVRGGISITFNARPAVIGPLVASHIVIAAAGAGLILVFGARLEKAFERLEEQSNIDGLTQIYNRRYFDIYLQREYSRARRLELPLSILMCDVDFFKSYNDRNGHQSGDDALKSIAATLQKTLKRPGDLVARYGGEEFAIILPDTPTEGALVVADMLRAAVEALKIPHRSSKVSKVITISLGYWTYNNEEMRVEDILEKVDKALYKAKESGRNIACCTD